MGIEIDQIPDFTVNQNGYDYETSLSTGFHYIECHECHSIIPFFVIPPVSPWEKNLVRGIQIADDPRFPSYLSIRCPKCNVDIQFYTGDESDNPFIEDTMILNPLEEWR